MSEFDFVSRRRVLGSAAALTLGISLAAAQEPKAVAATPTPAARPRTVILVRHGEKAADDPRDPGLSEAGKLRAAALLRLLGETKLTHVWNSEFKRTRDFVADVAAKHALVSEVVPGKDPAGLVARLQALPEGAISLVAGHSNTLPNVAKALGATLTNLVNGTDLRDDEYDRFVVITLAHKDEPCALLELRYGA